MAKVGGSSKYSKQPEDRFGSISLHGEDRDDTYIELEPDSIAAWWGDGADLGDDSSETKIDIAHDIKGADLSGSK